MKKILFLFPLAILLLILSSCEEIVDIEIKPGDERIVIEGLITDQAEVQTVKVSRTIAIDDSLRPEGVSGARVIISDDLGREEVLGESSPGIYQSNSLVGEVGRTYYLQVEAEGQTYTAESILPPSDKLDSVKALYYGNTIFTPDTGYFLSFYAQNRADIRSYYLAQLVVNDTLYLDEFLPYLLIDDRFSQGQYIAGFVVPYRVSKGDRARLVFNSLTPEGYDFYFGWLMQMGAGGPLGSPPANLSGNISNGALGYFRASSVQSEEVLVE